MKTPPGGLGEPVPVLRLPLQLSLQCPQVTPGLRLRGAPTVLRGIFVLRLGFTFDGYIFISFYPSYHSIILSFTL